MHHATFHVHHARLTVTFPVNRLTLGVERPLHHQRQPPHEIHFAIPEQTRVLERVPRHVHVHPHVHDVGHHPPGRCLLKQVLPFVPFGARELERRRAHQVVVTHPVTPRVFPPIPDECFYEEKLVGEGVTVPGFGHQQTGELAYAVTHENERAVLDDAEEHVLHLQRVLERGGASHTLSGNAHREGVHQLGEDVRVVEEVPPRAHVRQNTASHRDYCEQKHHEEE